MEKISVDELWHFTDSFCRLSFCGDTIEGVTKRTLTLEEMLSFVKEVAESCIDISTGEYMPESLDFALRSATVSYYTNIELPQNLEERYDFLYNTDICSKIDKIVDRGQYMAMRRAIMKKIDFMCKIIESSTYTKFAEVADKFSEISQSVEKIFGGVDTESMANIIKNIGKLQDASTEEIVSKVLDSEKKTNE